MKAIKKISLLLATALVAVGLCGFAPVKQVSAEVPTAQVALAEDENPFDVSISDDGSVAVSGTEESSVESWNNFLGRYKGIINGVAAVATLTMVVLLIIQFAKVAAAGDDPSSRKRALSGVLWTFIATAGIGAVDIILAIAYSAIK